MGSGAAVGAMFALNTAPLQGPPLALLLPGHVEDGQPLPPLLQPLRSGKCHGLSGLRLEDMLWGPRRLCALPPGRWVGASGAAAGGGAAAAWGWAAAAAGRRATAAAAAGGGGGGRPRLLLRLRTLSAATACLTAASHTRSSAPSSPSSSQSSSGNDTTSPVRAQTASNPSSSSFRARMSRSLSAVTNYPSSSKHMGHQVVAGASSGGSRDSGASSGGKCVDSVCFPDNFVIPATCRRSSPQVVLFCSTLR